MEPAVATMKVMNVVNRNKMHTENSNTSVDLFNCFALG